MKEYLGLDLGEKRIGVAAGSLEARLARPLGVINHQSAKQILIESSIIQEQKINSGDWHQLSGEWRTQFHGEACIEFWN